LAAGAVRRRDSLDRQGDFAGVARLKFDGLKWLSGVYLPRVFGSKAELPPNDDSDVLAVERKREMRRQILKELENLAVPAPMTIDQEVQKT
jgi:hypothetical protein